MVDKRENLDHKSQVQVSSNAYDDSPYKILSQTIKTTFDIDELDKQYQSSEYNQRQKLLQEMNQQQTTGQKIPNFFKLERNILYIKCILSSILLALCICVLVTFIVYNKRNANWFHPGYYALIAIIGVPNLIVWTTYIVKIAIFKKEIKRYSNGFDNTNVSITVQKLYKKLITSFSNINWFATYIYLTGLFALLVIFIVDYFEGLWYLGGQLAPHFGQLDWTSLAKDHQIPSQYGSMNLIALIVIGVLWGCVLIYQVTSQIFNYLRIHKIESSYNVPILEAEQIQTLKRETNKRNLIIFCIITLIFAVTLLTIFLILRNKKSK